MCILSNSLAVRNYVRVRVLRLASRVPVHACRALQRTFVNALTGTREKKREKEREKETGWDYRWFSSWCFLPAVSWTWRAGRGGKGRACVEGTRDEKTREEESLLSADEPSLGAARSQSAAPVSRRVPSPHLFGALILRRSSSASRCSRKQRSIPTVKCGRTIFSFSFFFFFFFFNISLTFCQIFSNLLTRRI